MSSNQQILRIITIKWLRIAVRHGSWPWSMQITILCGFAKLMLTLKLIWSYMPLFTVRWNLYLKTEMLHIVTWTDTQPTHYRLLWYSLLMWNLRKDSNIQLMFMHKQSFFLSLIWSLVSELPTVVVWCVSSLLNIIWLFFYTVEQGACITVAYPTKQMLMNLHIWVDLGDLNSVVWKICLLVLGHHLLLCPKHRSWHF